MAIYMFKLLVWYEPNGIDNAQGYRARMLRKCSETVKYIFTELPTRRDINYYGKMGIDISQMLSVHQYFTDNHTMDLSVKIEDKLYELKERLQYTDIIDRGSDIKLLRGGVLIASILRDEIELDFCKCIHYFSSGTRLVRTENYMGKITYVDYYITASSDAEPYAKHVRRTFLNSDGTVAYNQLFVEAGKEWYLFPDGRIYTKPEFIAEFIKNLHLTERDIILVDRLTQGGFMQSVFQFRNNVRLITVFHSRHFLEKGEDPDRLYLNDEYYDWFKYSHWIDTMVVSTPRQKEELAGKLQEYGCDIPRIEVIPAGGIDRMRCPKGGRNPYSLISVSRLYPTKRVDWIIKSVVKAHRKNPEISLDIYGRGGSIYTNYLKELVSENDAESYIRFMGYKDVTDIYERYEVFITASLGETLGLAAMEAVSSGAAMIGLNVKYGNLAFIQSGKNGYLVDFDFENTVEKEGNLIDDIADKILKIFEDKKRLEKFHEKSYEIARDYLWERIEKKWKKLLDC